MVVTDVSGISRHISVKEYDGFDTDNRFPNWPLRCTQFFVMKGSVFETIFETIFFSCRTDRKMCFFFNIPSLKWQLKANFDSISKILVRNARSNLELNFNCSTRTRCQRRTNTILHNGAKNWNLAVVFPPEFDSSDSYFHLISLCWPHSTSLNFVEETDALEPFSFIIY